jgi:hypothetical protein
MTGVNILIGLAVLVVILYRQLQARPVRDNMRLPLILGIVCLHGARDRGSPRPSWHHRGYLHP